MILKKENLKDKKIAFDFDGVIANTTIKKVKWFKKNNIKIKCPDKTNVYTKLSKNLTKEQIDEIYKKMSENIFSKRVLEKTKPLKGAVRVIKKLSKNHDIYIITARPKEMFYEINCWLKKYKIDKNIRKIISSAGKEKQEICKENNINVLCDDDLRHVKENKIDIRILFKNKENYIKGLYYINSWRKIEKFINKNDL